MLLTIVGQLDLLSGFSYELHHACMFQTAFMWISNELIYVKHILIGVCVYPHKLCIMCDQNYCLHLQWCVSQYHYTNLTFVCPYVRA